MFACSMHMPGAYESWYAPWSELVGAASQARAGALLKSKDAELRRVHDSATKEAAQRLADAEAALADTHQQLEQVCLALHLACC